jgi:CheY-like chemotaxis protein
MQRGNQELILVVDDDQTLRRSVAGGVTSWGFRAEEACDGHEALAKIKTFAPHVHG